MHLAVFVGMCWLADRLAGPLLHQAAGYMSPGHDDNWMDSWTVWWMRQALWLHPHNPFVSPIVEYPNGAEMYWHNLEPSKTIWGVVLVPLMGPVAAHNLLVWSTFPLAGYTAWLFVRYLLERQGVARHVANTAAFAGACVFAFSRYHLCHAEAHLNLSSIDGIPLHLFFLVRFLDRGRKGDLVGVAASAVYNAFCDSYYLLYATMFSLLWVVAEVRRKGAFFRLASWRTVALRRAAMAALAIAAVLSPWLLALLAHAFPAPGSPYHGDVDYAADIAGYLIPDRLSAWLPDVRPKWRELSMHLPGNNEENGYFLGYLTPVLGVIAARPPFLRDGPRWYGLALLFMVLSLGVDLSIAGTRDLDVWDVLAVTTTLFVVMHGTWRSARRRDLAVLLIFSTAVCYFVPVTANGNPFHAHFTLPYAVFKTVFPFFSRAGMPERFVLGATLAFAVLFGAFAGWVASRVRQPVVAAALGLAFAVIPCVEYRGRPIPMEPVPPPPAIFDVIRREPAEVAVFTDATAMSQFEQIYHGHPVTYARVARVPAAQAEYDRSHRINMALLHQKTLFDPVTERERAEMREYLRAHRFRYYIMHSWDPSRDRFVTIELGGRLLYQSSGTLYVYRFDDVT